MPPWGDNPFALLTFIGAPAILTNASSVMALGTSNRFARAIDRARVISAKLDNEKKSLEGGEVEFQTRQLQFSERRVMLLVRALTSFYVAVGAFAAASLVSLIGAGFSVIHHVPLQRLSLGLGLLAGLIGVGGLVVGNILLVRETRMTLLILSEETEQMLKRAARTSVGVA
jgi:hypothetical protein